MHCGKRSIWNLGRTLATPSCQSPPSGIKFNADEDAGKWWNKLSFYWHRQTAAGEREGIRYGSELVQEEEPAKISIKPLYKTSWENNSTLMRRTNYQSLLHSRKALAQHCFHNISFLERCNFSKSPVLLKLLKQICTWIALSISFPSGDSAPCFILRRNSSQIVWRRRIRLSFISQKD